MNHKPSQWKRKVIALAVISLSALLTACAATKETDDPSTDDADIQTYIDIDNRTSYILEPDDPGLKPDWGVWRGIKHKDKVEPPEPYSPQAISKKTTGKAFYARGRSGSWSGTEGVVTYRFKDDPSLWISIHFNNPYKSSTRHTLEVETANSDIEVEVNHHATNKPYYCTGTGSMQACTIVVKDLRR